MFIAKRQCVAFLKTVFGITVYSISILSLKPSLAFAATILCTEQMDLHGATLKVDSYDSTNPTRSTAGQYDPAKAGDEGAVACAGGITNSIPTGAAWIYGRLYTQTNSPITLGTNGGVGTHAWLASNTGIEPGYELSTSDYRLPDTAPPFSTGLTPQSGEIVFGRVTNFYDHILYDGDYVASDLAGYTIVLGKARLLATSLLLGGNDTITVTSNANLVLYAGGSTCSVGGNGIINESGSVRSCVIYVSTTVTNFMFNAYGNFLGVIVAPAAQTFLNGSGSTPNDFSGAIMTRSLTLNGNFRFHFDEGIVPASLQRSTASPLQFQVTGMPGFPYVVQASTNLSFWNVLTTNNSPFLFADPSNSQTRQRFYRAVCYP